MKKIFIFAVFCLLWPSLSLPYDGLTLYGAHLSTQDKVNSTGTPLNTVRAILQQDRANYYKFNKRDPQDQPDGFFTTVDKRALFQKMQIRIEPQLEKRILNGSAQMVSVFVYDENSMEVLEGLPNPNAD
ncbi:MAG: hypothetical protein HQM16_03145 [Deltaproteobacteria bacterium]|nr:hypothetical protein [Deltaproteobacteria bacterium]